MPFLPFPRVPGHVSRVLIAAVAFIPVVIVTTCLVPVLLIGPFLPVTRRATTSLIRHLTEWSDRILTAILGSPGHPPDTDRP